MVRAFLFKKNSSAANMPTQLHENLRSKALIHVWGQKP